MTINSKPLYGEVIGRVEGDRVIFTDQFMRFLDDLVNQRGQIPWDSLSKDGSNLSDLETREHAALQAVQGADDTDVDATQDKHISNLQAKTWTDNDAKQVDDTDTNTVRDKHVSNALAKAWSEAGTGLTSHIAQTSAHGATGNIVGRGDTATEVLAGVVLQASAVVDAAASTVSVDSDSINSAPTVYDQTWGGEVQALANECKGDVNQLVADVNAIKDQFNALLTALRAAGTVAT